MTAQQILEARWSPLHTIAAYDSPCSRNSKRGGHRCTLSGARACNQSGLPSSAGGIFAFAFGFDFACDFEVALDCARNPRFMVWSGAKSYLGPSLQAAISCAQVHN